MRRGVIVTPVESPEQTTFTMVRLLTTPSNGREECYKTPRPEFPNVSGSRAAPAGPLTREPCRRRPASAGRLSIQCGTSLRRLVDPRRIGSSKQGRASSARWLLLKECRALAAGQRFGVGRTAGKSVTGAAGLKPIPPTSDGRGSLRTGLPPSSAHLLKRRACVHRRCNTFRFKSGLLPVPRCSTSPMA